MSTLPQVIDRDAVDRLGHVLERLSNSDNQIRMQAEKELHGDWLMRDGNQFLLGLVTILCCHPDPNFRSFASILLRRMGLRLVQEQSPADQNQSFTVHLWATALPQVRSTVKQFFLHSLRTETNRSVRRKVCDTISEVVKLGLSPPVFDAQLGIPEAPAEAYAWPELLQAMFECAKSPAAELRESAFVIFGAVPELLLETAQTHFNVVKSVLLEALNDQTNIRVRLAAFKATVAFLMTEDLDGKLRTHLAGELMNSILACLLAFQSIAGEDEELLIESLTALIELVEPYPKLIRPILKPLVPFLVQLMRSQDMEDSSRQSALEVLITLAENGAPMCRKLEAPGFASQVVPVTLEMMAEIEDSQEWYTLSTLEETDSEDENYIAAEQAMDRFARSLGGKHLLPPVFSLLPELLKSGDWRHRYAALMCISAIGEGCAKIMETELGQILDLVIPFLLSDPHPRVRYAACNSVGQMCTDFGPNLQLSYHEKIVVGLCSTMDAKDQPRVQAHGAAALVNFCEHATPEIISPYLDAIFERLTVLLQTNKMFIQEQAITTLATVADAAAEGFVQYYPGIMPVLLSIMQQATSKDYRLLRGKAMECASLVALAVGKEVFQPHANVFIGLLTQTQATATEADDPQISYLLASWARICKVLGPDFVPHLNVVMPPLLASARHRPEFTMLELDMDPEEQGYSEEDGWEFIKMDDKKVGINTTALEEKCTAVEMLICYARELGAGFQPYAEEVLRLVVPMLRFYFHEGVRHAAAAVFPHIFNSMKLPGFPIEKLLSLWHEACSSLLIVIHDEPDAESLVQFLVAFYETMEVMGIGSLDNAVLRPLMSENSTEPPKLNAQIANMPLLTYFTRAITGQVAEAMSRIQARDQQRQDKDMYDPEMEENLQDQDDMEDSVLGELSRAIHIVFKTHSHSFLPHFRSGLLPAVKGMLHQTNENVLEDSDAPRSLANQAKQWAICVFDDLIEFCGAQAAIEFRTDFWDPFLQGVVNQTSPDVRQACCYGIGMLAFRASPQKAENEDVHQAWISTLLESINILFASLSSPWANSSEHVLANDNAVSALGKLLHYQLMPLVPAAISANQVHSAVRQWLSHLPLNEDDEEAPHTYGFLLELIAQQNPGVMQDLGLLLKTLVLAVAGDMLNRSTADWEGYGPSKGLAIQLIEATRAISKHCNDAVKQEIWLQLNENQRQKVQVLGLG